MLVVDSKSYPFRYSLSEQPATVKALQPKIGQNHRNGSHTLWTHMGKTLITYMHIWLVEFEAILQKANFILYFKNHFIFHLL